jgi:serine phosphatase RsbU (regulator of sigma subunit)/class 3 adenylate cyclase
LSCISELLISKPYLADSYPGKSQGYLWVWLSILYNYPMNCPVCNTLNAPGARYCLNCGAALHLRCTRCGAELPPNAHFCMNCGQAVGSFSAADTDRLSRMAAAAPEPLAAKLRASASLAGEQRLVTALFLDVVDSTNLAQQIGEEAWIELINEAFNHYYPIIYRYEGTLARVQQDTLLAFFGAPVAHEDDPIRAVYAALDLIEETRSFAARQASAMDVSFAVRVGLSTGPVIINAIRSDLMFDYRPVGNLINLASRIQTLVPSNAIALSEETHEYIAPFAESTMHCMVNVEGQKEPICVYQLHHLVTEPDPIRGLTGLESRMVGREPDLETLLNLAETVRAGLGRAALIIGEPGIGKTRLIDEWYIALTRSAGDTAYFWYRARSQSYDSTSAYHLLSELIYAILGLTRQSTEAEIRAALLNRIAELSAEPSEIYPYLAHLLAVPLTGEDLNLVNSLDPQALQNQIQNALGSLIRAQASQKPVILVLEDLHWADPSSLEQISRLLPQASSAPLLFCLAMRSEREAHGGDLIRAAREALGDSLTIINLKPLSDEDSELLLANLLEVDTLPEETRRLILGHAEGNPLFVEEMIRMLISQGALVPENGSWICCQENTDMVVPATLQGLLLARIDRLPTEARDTLRVASVIGRSFQLNLLENIVGNGTLLGHMSTLESAGLLRVAQVKPDLAYSFRHALVHEAIYASLLPEDRQQLHQAVGETLERLFPDQQQELAPRLAAHFNAAGDRARSIRYFRQSGENALASFANQEAENHFRSALALCEREEIRTGLLTRLGEALFNQGRYTDAIKSWREAIQLYQNQHDNAAEARLYAYAARAAWHAGDTPGSLKICEEALTRLDMSADSAGVAALLHETARARYFNGINDQVEVMCRQALAIAEKLGEINIQADTLATLGLLTDLSPEEGIACLQRAVELAEENKLMTTAARAHINLGTTLVRLRGDLRTARKHYWRAAEIHHMRGAVAEELFARISVTDVSFTLGELASVEEALHNLEKLNATAPDPGLSTVWLKTFEANLMASRGEWAVAIPIMRSYREDARSRRDLINLGDVSRFLGWTLLEMAQWGQSTVTDEALEALLEALDAYQRNMKPTVNLKCLLAILYTVRAEERLARQYLEDARQDAGENPIPLEASWILWATAMLDTYLEHWDSALQAFQSAVETVIPVGLRWHWARLLKDWSEALILRGESEDLEQAQTLLRQSQELFEQLGAPEYAHRVENRLQEITSESLVKAAAHRRVSSEMAMAGRVQASFQPGVPAMPSDWQISATLRPARLTSGDFYDFIRLPEEHMGILIGDVADKGVGAALFMTFTRTLIRTYAIELPDRPEEVFAAVNRRMLEDSTVGLFVTAFYGVLEPGRGIFNYINAGHNPPYLLSHGQSEAIASLTRTGIPLGIFNDAEWEIGQIQLNPGDTLIMYTDGVTEAQNPSGDFYGEERLIEAIQKHAPTAGSQADDLQEALLGDLQDFTGEQPRLDDLALVILRHELESGS